tara:strand:+ start:231 stop:479 length:249 start_codon:yes stop_codon:yes gene_type:complete
MAYAAMVPLGGWKEAVKQIKKRGFQSLSKHQMDLFTVFEKQKKEFIDGPKEPGLGVNALMNICKPIDVSLMNGQKPYPRLFT